MMKITPQFLVFILALFTWISPLTAQVLYNEGFDSIGEGATGDCLTSDPTSCATYVAPTGPWSMTGDFSGLDNGDDWFRTALISGQSYLEGHDVNFELCFESDPIDISTHSSVVVSVDLTEVGTNESTDYVDVILEVDGTPMTIIDFAGLGSSTHTVIDDFAAAMVQGEASGSSLVVKVCMMNNGSGEKYRINSVEVEVGSLVPPVSTPNIVINEINYNPIESGTDLTEFIELINLEDGAVDLSAWSFDPSEGVDFTFPAGASVGSGEYVVIAGNAVAFEAEYGCPPDYEWAAGGLSNAGEDVVLRDASGNMVDIVNYDDASPWPGGSSGPDGNGPSLELLDPSAENSLPVFWAASIVDGGTPGGLNQTNETLCPIPSIVLDYKNSENGSNALNNKFIKPQLRIKNEGSIPVELKDITARYFFSDEIAPYTFTLECQGSDVGCSSTLFLISDLVPAQVGADKFLQLGFTGGTILPGEKVNTKAKIGNTANASMDESNDFSSIGAPITDHVNNPYIALYYKGRLIQGSEPNMGSSVRTIELVRSSVNTSLDANVFPNPFSNGFALELQEAPDMPVQIRLVNMMGQIVHQGEFQTASTYIKLDQNLVTGIYYLQMSQGEKRETFQLIKE